jgi:hypothetical protein
MESGAGKVVISPQLRVEFRGATATCDTGLLLPHGLDECPGLSALIEGASDPRAGYNRRFHLPDLFRKSVYRRVAGQSTKRLLTLPFFASALNSL